MGQQIIVHAGYEWFVRFILSHVGERQNCDRLGALALRCFVDDCKLVDQEVRDGDCQRDNDYVVDGLPRKLRRHVGPGVPFHA